MIFIAYFESSGDFLWLCTLVTTVSISPTDTDKAMLAVAPLGG